MRMRVRMRMLRLAGAEFMAQRAEKKLRQGGNCGQLQSQETTFSFYRRYNSPTVHDKTFTMAFPWAAYRVLIFN